MSTQHELDYLRYRVKVRLRARMREELKPYADENGLIIKQPPSDLWRQAVKINLVKAFDFGYPNRQGYKSHWFIRFDEGKGYAPPGIDSYRNMKQNMGT